MQTLSRTLPAVALAMSVVALLAGGGATTAQGTGTLEVSVKYNGAPVVEIIKVNKDTQVCGTEAKLEKVALGPTKGLAHAVVSVPTASGSGAQPPAVEPTLDQKGCTFVPHVVAMLPGEIEILNSDGVLHNLHTSSTANPIINKAQPRFKKTMTVGFEKPEFIKVRCDVHSWMLGWIAVMPTPYFGVTGPEGVVKIEHVPAGKHEVEVWHEVLGKREKAVAVKTGEVTRVSFEMRE
jgi:hypothetical protein